MSPYPTGSRRWARSCECNLATQPESIQPDCFPELGLRSTGNEQRVEAVVVLVQSLSPDDERQLRQDARQIQRPVGR